ncbi:SPOR domain-containing protein [Magnetococcales bacterium HHB-1]
MKGKIFGLSLAFYATLSWSQDVCAQWVVWPGGYATPVPQYSSVYTVESGSYPDVYSPFITSEMMPGYLSSALPEEMPAAPYNMTPMALSSPGMMAPATLPAMSPGMAPATLPAMSPGMAPVLPAIKTMMMPGMRGVVFTVHEGSYLFPQNAIRASQRIRHLGLQAYQLPVSVRGQNYIRISAGLFRQHAQAEQVLRRLQQTGKFQGRVIRYIF